MADKIISFPATTNYIRYRDMWDLVWLNQQGAKPDINLVIKKITDYKLNNEFQFLLQNRIDSLTNIIKDSNFLNEMKRFLPSNIISRTIEDDNFLSYLSTTLNKLLTSVQFHIYKKQALKNNPPFEM